MKKKKGNICKIDVYKILVERQAKTNFFWETTHLTLPPSLFLLVGN